MKYLGRFAGQAEGSEISHRPPPKEVTKLTKPGFVSFVSSPPGGLREIREAVRPLPSPEGRHHWQAVRVWSRLLQAYVWVTRDQSPDPAGYDAPAYTVAEIEALKDVSPEELRQAHEVKQIFPGSQVEECGRYQPSQASDSDRQQAPAERRPRRRRRT